MNNTKICTDCGEPKDFSEFSPRKHGKNGLNSQCKSCRSKDAREYRLENKEKYIENNRNWRKNNPGKYSKRTRGYVLKRYGISEEEYDEIFEKQSGVCAICKDKPTGTLHIDHDHVTGKVRGLLCHRCNTSMGLMKENKDNLGNMIDYLKSNLEDK